MFRIDRNLVNIGDARFMRTIKIFDEVEEAERIDEAGEAGENGETGETGEPGGTDGTGKTGKTGKKGEITEAGVTGKPPNAAVFVAARSLISNAEAEAKARANEIITEAMAKAELEAQASADKIISNAREEAESLKNQAREQLDNERDSARQEGFAEGEKEGRRTFDEQLEAKQKELGEEYDNKRSEDDEKLKRVIEELYDERTKTYDELEEQVVGLSLDIVRKVLNPSDEGFGDVFDMLIKNALKQINPDGKILIRVSPSEYERFFSSGSALFELEGGVTVTASVHRDVSLGDGDCIIDTEDETIDIGLDSQLRLIKLAFDRA